MATKRKRSKDDDSPMAVDRKTSRVKGSSFQQQLNLLGLYGQGPLNDILDYCSAVDLAQAEMVCKTLRTAAIPVWKSLAERLPAPTAQEVNLFGQDESAKDRVVRWKIACAYAKRMEKAAAEHFDYDNDSVVVRCNGCNELPSLDIRFLGDDHRVFFIRLSYRNPKDGNARTAHDDDDDPLIICQGFVHKIPDPNRAHILRRFDITDVLYSEDALVWPELQQVSNFLTQHCHNQATTALIEQFRELYGAALRNAAVTVIAMEHPGICRLVVATGGCRQQQAFFQSAFQNRTYLPHQIDSLRVCTEIGLPVVNNNNGRYHLEITYG